MICACYLWTSVGFWSNLRLYTTAREMGAHIGALQFNLRAPNACRSRRNGIWTSTLLKTCPFRRLTSFINPYNQILRRAVSRFFWQREDLTLLNISKTVLCLGLILNLCNAMKIIPLVLDQALDICSSDRL